MKSGNRFAVLMVALCTMSGAQAATIHGGTISFVGAITASACVASDELDGAVSSGGVLRCNQNPSLPSSLNESVYQLSVEQLNAQTASGNPLLAYFVGQPGSGRLGNARMLTRSYE